MLKNKPQTRDSRRMYRGPITYHKIKIRNKSRKIKQKLESNEILRHKMKITK
jgi:hypothetical protein